MSAQNTSQTKVLYNAECPVCSREIKHYARISQDSALPIAFEDLNTPAALDAWGLSRDAAAKRLHVRQGQDIVSGVPAFILLWQQIPKYRWLARVVSLPGVYRIAVWIYDGVLAPVLFRWHKLRETAR